MPPDLALLSTLIGSNNPCLKLILIFMVPKVFEPLKFGCIFISSAYRVNLYSHFSLYLEKSLDLH